MAKPKKGGLGRGLNSLLGNEGGGSLPQENSSRVERVVVENDTPRRSYEPKRPSVPVVAPQKEEEKKVDEPKREDVKASEGKDNVYSNKEDNITIKEVVPRVVERKEPEPSKEKKEEKREREKVAIREDDEVSIDLVEPNPNQPRTNFKKDELEELADSIKKNGLLQPILVRKIGDKYEIIAGERRWQACKSIGMKKVPIRVREVTDDETILLALIENIQRSDLNPIEEAYGYRRMMERNKMTQTQIAQAVSKGRSTIANSLRLLELPEEAQELLFEEKITAGHARAILSVPTKEGRAKLTEKLKNEQLSVREVEAIARLMSVKREEKSKERPQVPKSYKTVARSLRDSLQTEVRVKSVKGKNKIEIEFKDEADLERLFRLITKE